jgi:hypothetical protein
MADSTSPGAVVLDWRHAAIGPLAPCVCCGRPALCRSPAKDVPCHKGCAEAWINDHARDAAHQRQLIRAYSSKGSAR